jgi:hypothetical protein
MPGGRASDDAIRSLVISYKLLGTKEWFVIHHTNCGMEFFTDQVMRDLLANSLETAELGPDGFTDVGSGSGINMRPSTSTGSRSATTPGASSRTSPEFGTTPSSPVRSPFTATSTT